MVQVQVQKHCDDEPVWRPVSIAARIVTARKYSMDALRGVPYTPIRFM